MIILGADENGLGPVLGAMTSTAVTLQMDAYDRERLRDIGMSAGIHDSKQTSAFGKMRTAESLALAVICGESRVLDVDDLFELLSLDPVSELSRPCPAKSKPQCWKMPLALPFYGGSVEEGLRMLDSLRRAGVHVLRAKTVINCPLVLNRFHAAGRNKLGVDLMNFERLILDARENVNEELEAWCGMVGGMRKYTEQFTYFQKLGSKIITEEKGLSSYRVPKIGRVHFEVSADDKHVPVAMASMIGKYVRELWMTRMMKFYRAQQPELQEASGYRDPVTKKFIAETSSLRASLRISDECFKRNA